jgi:hypothetical protein
VFISNLDGQRKVVAVGATKDGIILKEDTDLFDEAIRLATGVGNVTNSASSNS